MKPNFIKSGSENEASFSFRVDHLPCINNRWHYHQEFELIYFQKGSGTQFIGDSITGFYEGNVMLIGPQLEHYWQFEDQYFSEGHDANVEAYVVHFDKNFCGNAFFNLPECADVLKLLERAKRGIKVVDSAQKVAECLVQMNAARGYERLTLLIRALGIISEDDSAYPVVTNGFGNLSIHNDKRIDLIVEYLSKNLQNHISLKDLSEVAAMNPTSLCRYFKAKANESLSSYIEKMRVGNACKLIAREEMSMKQIAHESGFRNLTSFHKSFRKLKGTTPLMFQQRVTGKQ